MNGHRPDFLFCPGGGIGDSIVSLPALDFLIEHIAPYADIDVLTGFSRNIYKEIIGSSRAARIRHYFEKELPHTQKRYQGSLAANEICQVMMGHDMAKMILMRNPELMRLLKVGQDRLKELDPSAPYHSNELANQAVSMGLSRITLPLWSLGLNNPFPGPKLSTLPTSISGSYITINDGWAGDSPNRITKAWSEDGWIKLVELCRDAGIKTVQLGSDSNGQDYPVDTQLRGKSTFAESLSILSGSLCHVDIEGGLVHAAAAMEVPCVVLFGPTNREFFGYPKNINLIHGSCQNCWWTKTNWMNNCPKDNHVCMKHDPVVVFESIKSFLETECPSLREKISLDRVDRIAKKNHLSLSGPGGSFNSNQVSSLTGKCDMRI